MVKKATSVMFVSLLLIGLFSLNWPVAKAQTASPTQAVITVSGVPTGTAGLAVEVTVDTAVVSLSSSASSSVSGALVVTGSMSEGVGIISTSGDLPATFTITVPFTGVAAGTSMVAVGMVLDMLGGTEIVGALAGVDADSVDVSGTGSSTSTSSTSSTGGVGGMLSSDTVTITINGDAVNQTNALNVTLSFTDTSVVELDAGVTFMGTGATQLLTDVNTTTNVITAVWDGLITDGQAVITAMLKAGSMAGTSMIGVTKVEAAGGTDITSNIAATVDPDEVTNSSTTTSDCGTFTLLSPSSVTGPGKVAVSIATANAASGLSATLNGAMVGFAGGKGVAIISIPSTGDLSLMLAATCSGMTANVDLGTIDVTAGTGKAPKATSASASNKSTGTKLTVLGKKFSKTDTSVVIAPTDHTATSTMVSGSRIKSTYDSSECIPNGSYVNVSTPGGTSARKIKVRGSCSNSL